MKLTVECLCEGLVVERLVDKWEWWRPPSPQTGDSFREGDIGPVRLVPVLYDGESLGYAEDGMPVITREVIHRVNAIEYWPNGRVRRVELSEGTLSYYEIARLGKINVQNKKDKVGEGLKEEKLVS